MVLISMNRAVHLALRDAHYRRCVEELERSFGESSIVKRRERIERILGHLAEARHEAECALRGHRGWRAERMFVKFLTLIYDAAKAAQVMILHEGLLREDKSFLKKLLGSGASQLVQFEERNRSMEGEILERVAKLVLHASPTYSDLKKANMESLSPQDQSRYRIAYDAVIPHTYGAGR